MPRLASSGSRSLCLPSLQHGKLVLEEPLSGCSLFEAALFLRLCYRPQDVSHANLAAQRPSLPALLRLAHKLDAGRIMKEIVNHMKGEQASVQCSHMRASAALRLRNGLLMDCG